MGKLVRFGVSMESGLLAALDASIKNTRFGNRSKALSELVNKEVGPQKVLKGAKIVGTISMVYSVFKRLPLERIAEVKLEFSDIILAAQNVPWGKGDMFEAMIISGPGSRAKSLADSLGSIKGVSAVALSITASKPVTAKAGQI